MIRLFRQIKPSAEHAVQLDKILEVAKEVAAAVEESKNQLVAKANGAMYHLPVGGPAKDASKS